VITRQHDQIIKTKKKEDTTKKEEEDTFLVAKSAYKEMKA
jgi:hypothetical protein